MKLELPRELGLYYFMNDKCTIEIKFEYKSTGYHIEVSDMIVCNRKQYQSYTTTPSALKALQGRVEKYLEKIGVENEFKFLGPKTEN